MEGFKYKMGEEWGKNRGGKPSRAALCKVLEEETGEDRESINKKFRNVHGDGICDKLENRLGFKIDEFADEKNSYENKISELKLLKLLYIYEKIGANKKDVVVYRKRKIRILDILSRPQLSNITDEYSSYSRYGKVIDSLLEELEKEVPDAAARKVKIKDLDFWWECICEESSIFFTSDYALYNGEKGKTECIEKANMILQDLNMILSSLPSDNDINHIHKESVIESFYNLVICHISNCTVQDRLRLEGSEIDTVNEIYAKLSRDNEYAGLPFGKSLQDFTNLLTDYFKNLKRKVETVEPESVLLYLLKQGWEIKSDISYEDRRDYLYALKYVNTLMEWIMDEKRTTECYILVYIAALQEIIRVKRGSYKIHEKYFGNSEKPYAALTPLRDKRKASAYAKQWWIRRVEIRCVVNIGDCGLFQKHLEIQNIIYQIKEKSYRYQNFDDIMYASKYLMKKVYEVLQKHIGTRKIDSETYTVLDNKVNERIYRFVTIEWAFGCEKILYGLKGDEMLLDDLADRMSEVLKDINFNEGSVVIPASKATPWLDSVGIKLLVRHDVVTVYDYFLEKDKNLKKRLAELLLSRIEEQSENYI